MAQGEPMKDVIKVTPLSDGDTMAVLKLPKFNGLKPVKCEDCGHGGDFARRVFNISGVQKNKYCDDEIQGVISSYIRKTFGIAYVFFKSSKNKFYADSAICPRCQSTRIIFDIELTDDFLRQAARLTGKSIEELRRGIEATADRLACAETKKA
jgi:hypothetical protein